MKTVILYTKPGCHLCEVVEKVIEQVRQRRQFEFQRRNITDDPADFEKYQFHIPVVTVDGKEVARYRLSERKLEEALDAEA